MLQRLPFFLLLYFLACNTASVRNSNETDSLGHYPQAPVSMPVQDFRRFYREISAFFDSCLLQTGFNGAILVARDGQILYEKYQGRTGLQKGDSISPSTSFQLASTSKPITATAVLQLAQEGKLSLSDTMGKYFPGFPYPGITVKMLLNHRSGLPNYLYFMSNYKWGILPNGKWNRQMALNRDMLHMLMKRKPNPTGPPDRKFNYSNTNYTLLALIVESVTGRSFPEHMKETLFDPLGMTDTYVYTPADSSRSLLSYSVNGTRWDNDFLDGTYGDKNIYSTPRDLLKWDRALHTGKLLSANWLDSAFRAYSLEKTSVYHYGLGWRLEYIPNGKKVIYHFGKWHGFNAAYAYLPAEKVTILILGNRFNRNIYRAGHLCYDLFGDYRQHQPVEAEISPEAVKVTEKPLKPGKAKTPSAPSKKKG